MKRLALLVPVLATLFFIAHDGGAAQPNSSGGQSGGEAGVDPAHEQVLNSIPIYPGSVRDGDDLSTGAGSFARFWVTANSTLVGSFYGQELPLLDWRPVGEPKTLGGGKGSQIAQTFTKDRFSLTIYLDENPAKGRERGNLQLMFRLIET